MGIQTQVNYTEAGAGPPLLLLHGLFDTLATWERLIPHLSLHFKVYAIDLPGFGQSPLPEQWDESLSGMVASVIAFLEEKKIERLSLIGNSMGGSLALAIAESHPARIDKIGLLNPYGLPEAPFAMKKAQRWGTLLSYLLGKRALKQCARSIFSRSLHDNAFLTPSLIEGVARPFSSVARRKDLFRFLRAISMEKVREIDALLPTLFQPVLILWGAEDRWLSPAHWKRLEARIPGSSTIQLPQCGHLPQVEKQEAVAAALIPFLLKPINPG